MNEIYADHLPQPRSRLRFALWGFGGFLLLPPAAAMQMTREVNWGPEDFLAAALLIGAAGLGCELVVRRAGKGLLRAALIGAVELAALLVWAELAVGILD